MVKLFAFLARRSDLSHDEFLDHWWNRHGPLIAGEPTLARHIVRYEQHARLHPGALSGSEHCDGVTEQWFESMDEFVVLIQEPAYAELIAPDEPRFLDLQRLRFVICDEPRVVIGGSKPHGS